MEFEGYYRQSIALAIVKSELYPKKITDIIMPELKHHHNICYVCLARPFARVISQMKSASINTDSFIFIIFENPPTDLQESHFIFAGLSPTAKNLKDSMIKAIYEKNCDEIFIDNISSLLNYEGDFQISKLVHEMKTEKTFQKNTLEKYFLIAVRGEHRQDQKNESLIKDLCMFGDIIFSIETDFIDKGGDFF